MFDYRIITTLSMLMICLQLVSCGYPEAPTVKLKGPNDINDLVFFYKPEATHQQKELFQNSILHKADPEAKGYDLPDGVIDLMYVRQDGYEGYALNFSKNAPPQQQEMLKLAIQRSPIVYKVYENVAPSQIKNL